MAKLRRVGGKMESSRVFGGRRALLPYEVELCNALGITEEEYWQFIYLAESVSGKRRKEYDLIPDIVNMPPVAIAPFAIGGISIGFYGVVAIGVALSYISAALAPKPKAPKTPPSLQTEGAQSVKRFAPQSGFNSLQELAVIGETIPLIFTKRDPANNIGGIRVNSKLVWSQLRSLGTHQQLKGVFIFSNEKIPTPPDFEGYAIGDLLLKNYTGAKIALYYKGQKIDGKNRILETDKYDKSELAREIGRDGSNPDDVFSIDWDRIGTFSNKIFCGVRTPTTQSRFGNFSPMPNMMRYQLPYELVLKAKDASNKDDIDKKRKKIAKYYPRYAGFLKHQNEEKHGRFRLEKGHTVRYTIGDMNPINDIEGDFNPWGLQDVKTAVDSDRERIDDNIALGESYLIGSALAVCTEIQQDRLWAEGTYKDFDFKITDLGPDSEPHIDIRGSSNGFRMAHSPWQLNTLQKVAVASISNNRDCDVTEIGLKSKVFKQITGFPNVNSHPGDFSYTNPSGTLNTYQNDNGNINLGPLNKYVTRYSFFRLQARKANSTDDFTTIDNGKPFAIKGRTPQFQYNFIRINHPKSQYEFRFVPYPGNEIKRSFIDNRNSQIRLLRSNAPLQQDTSGSFGIRYAGFDVTLTGGDVSNSEWFLGEVPETGTELTGLAVNSVGFTDNNVGTWTTTHHLFDFPTEDGIVMGSFAYILFMEQMDPVAHFVFEGKYIGAVELQRGFSVDDIVYYESDSVRYVFGDFVESGGEEEGPIEVSWDDYKIKRQNLLPSGSTVVHTSEDVSLTTANGGGSGAKVTIQLFSSGGALWFLTDPGSGYTFESTVNIPAVSGGGQSFSGLNGVQALVTSQEFVTDPWPDNEIGDAVNNKNILPYGAVADFISFEAEVPSHMEEPEHEIVYVNEQVEGSGDFMNYRDLTVSGIRINSSKEFSSFSQLSAYFKEGLSIKNLIDGTIGPSNLFPDIVFALLTDPLIGAGDLIGVRSVDEDRMKIASQFCKANNLFWDGVIVDEKNLREFIFQNAQYCLLDFTILGGRFSLFPSVPFNPSTFLIEPSQKPFIKALFTDGNTKNLQVSFLSAEERQDFRGFASYRHETENGFPETKVINRRLNTTTENDPRENFDLSLFCTSSEHARIFLDYALKIRNKVDHGVTFDTTPQSAMHLAPGDYIRLHSEATHTNRFANGVITDDGVIQSQKNIEDLTPIFFWKPGDVEVKSLPIRLLSNGKAADAFRGSVFTVPDTSVSDRVYKIESISYGEDGLINISASFSPLNADDTLAVMNYSAHDII